MSLMHFIAQQVHKLGQASYVEILPLCGSSYTEQQVIAAIKNASSRRLIVMVGRVKGPGTQRGIFKATAKAAALGKPNATPLNKRLPVTSVWDMGQRAANAENDGDFDAWKRAAL